MGFDATQQFNTVIPSCFVDNFKQSLSLIKILIFYLHSLFTSIYEFNCPLKNSVIELFIIYEMLRGSVYVAMNRGCMACKLLLIELNG